MLLLAISTNHPSQSFILWLTLHAIKLQCLVFVCSIIYIFTIIILGFFSLSSGSALLWKAGSVSLITPGKSNWKYALKKEPSFYLFWKTKPRHSCQIFLTVRMIEEGWYFIGHFLACALALAPTQWLQSRKGNCMCQCPKEKKQTGFI